MKANAETLALEKGFEDEWTLLDIIERVTPRIFKEERGVSRPMCANVDLYSGLIYKTLGIPMDLYTPMFAIARVAGWCAHRLEEIVTSTKIIRPGYKSLAGHTHYIPLGLREKEAGK